MRLARGRDLLRQRLVRRGVTVSSAALGALILQNASSAAYAMSDTVIQSVMASTPFGVVNLISSGGPLVTPNGVAIEVMKGVLQTMLYQKLIATASLLVLGGILTASSVTVLVRNSHPALQRQASQEATPSPAKATVPSSATTRQLATASPKNPAGPEEDFRSAANRAIEREDEAALWQIVNAWIEKDHAGFVERARPLPKQLPEGEVRDIALSVLARAWAKKDPLAVAQLAQQLPEGDARNKALWDVAQTWVKINLSVAISWAERLPSADSAQVAGKVVPAGGDQGEAAEDAG